MYSRKLGQQSIPGHASVGVRTLMYLLTIKLHERLCRGCAKLQGVVQQTLRRAENESPIVKFVTVNTSFNCSAPHVLATPDVDETATCTVCRDERGA
jgi:hypothetical protein